RQAEALRAYQSARAGLVEELGIEPAPELRAVEAAILQQADVPAVPRIEPPARRRTNAPAPITSPVGRRDEVHDLERLLEKRRLVTIHGPGGSGKTRLAIELARRWHERGDGDAWFIELARVAEPDLVVPTIAAALEVSEGADGDESLT